MPQVETAEIIPDGDLNPEKMEKNLDASNPAETLARQNDALIVIGKVKTGTPLTTDELGLAVQLNSSSSETTE